MGFKNADKKLKKREDKKLSQAIKRNREREKKQSQYEKTIKGAQFYDDQQAALND